VNLNGISIKHNGLFGQPHFKSLINFHYAFSTAILIIFQVVFSTLQTGKMSTSYLYWVLSNTSAQNTFVAMNLFKASLSAC
jgi:hypothetical protein